MASRSLRIWLGLAPIVLLAMACESVGAADHTLALCESALARRLAIENDQARFVSTNSVPIPLSHLVSVYEEDTIAYVAYAVEWERLEAKHAEASRDIGAHCLEPAGIATPTPSPTPTVTPVPTPTRDPAAPRPRGRVLTLPTPTPGGE